MCILKWYSLTKLLAGKFELKIKYKKDRGFQGWAFYLSMCLNINININKIMWNLIILSISNLKKSKST